MTTRRSFLQALGLAVLAPVAPMLVTRRGWPDPTTYTHPLGEFMVWDRALSLDEQAEVERYIVRKYELWPTT